MADNKSWPADRRVPFDRIVFLLDEYPPMVIGGIATWAFELGAALARRGYAVTMLLPRKLRKRATETIPGVEVRFVGWHDWPKYRGTYSLLGLIPLLLRHERLLVVGSTWQHLTGIAPLRRLLNVHTMCFSHGTDATRGISPERREKFGKVLARTDLFAPTSGFLERLVRDSFPDVKFRSRLIYNGIDVGHFRPRPESRAAFRAAHGIDPGAIVIASAGRMVPAKGFTALIRAVALAIERVPGLHCCIAGKKEEEYARIKELAATLGIEARVSFTGGIPYNNLPDFYSAANIFTSASIPLRRPYYIEDNFPMTLLEAAACGLPLIGTRCGGIPEIIDEPVCGFIVPPDDPGAMAERLVMLAKDPYLRKRTGEAARERVCTRFDRERTADSFLEAAAAAGPDITALRS
jgi:glycosyltransferase involved in cell wall biosynthesis